MPGTLILFDEGMSRVVVSTNDDADYSAETGRPKALMDATVLTWIRTAGGSGAATDLLADPNAHVLTVFGAGQQAEAHIHAMIVCRPIQNVRPVGSVRSCRSNGI